MAHILQIGLMCALNINLFQSVIKSYSTDTFRRTQKKNQNLNTLTLR